MGLLIFLLVYIVTLNLVGFILCGVDKRRAKQGRWRIPEATLLLTGLCGGCFGLLAGMGVFRHKTKHAKFKILAPLECLLWLVVVIHLISGLTLDRRIQYVEVPYASPQVAAALDGYTIAFVTDTHAISAAELTQVVGRINGYAPDLLLLGGDFQLRGQQLEQALEILSAVWANDGVYGVEGNHDEYRALFAAMEKHGIIPLSNSGVTIREHLYLAGVEDLWNRAPDIAQATQGAAADDFVLLLAHNPDVTMQQDTSGVDLTLSGHTHGGHATLFGLVAPALAWVKDISAYGQRFMSGWAKSRDGADVFVSNGTGYLSVTPRVFARPQVIVVTLKHLAD